MRLLDKIFKFLFGRLLKRRVDGVALDESRRGSLNRNIEKFWVNVNFYKSFGHPNSLYIKILSTIYELNYLK